jgi:adenine-specific DNA-methyltransferase
VNFVSERDGVFADVLQETMLATYRRRGKTRRGKVGFIEISVDGEVSFRKAGAFSLPARPAAPWLLPRTPDQAALTRRLRAMPHRLSDYGYGVSTGPLVWNRFKGQFRSQAGDTRFPVIWAESVTSDGRFVWRSEKRNHAPWFAAKRPKDDWLIVTQPCVLLQRTTAKEQARRLIAAELPANFIRKHEGVTVENHLNMVRAITPKARVAAAVIAALLNSATVDAAFRCINGSVAVSAFELEELPLPSPAVIRRLAKLVAAQARADAIEAVIATAYERVDAAAAACCRGSTSALAADFSGGDAAAELLHARDGGADRIRDALHRRCRRQRDVDGAEARLPDGRESGGTADPRERHRAAQRHF